MAHHRDGDVYPVTRRVEDRISLLSLLSPSLSLIILVNEDELLDISVVGCKIHFMNTKIHYLHDSTPEMCELQYYSVNITR